MLKYKYVFAQLVKFRQLVDKYDGDKYVKSYTCWNQLLTLIFGYLSNRGSLRDLIVSMEAHAVKLYHLGIGRDNRGAIPQPMERGTVLQMDQAASVYQEVLGNIRECSMHPNLLCHNYLLPCGNRATRYETGVEHR